VDEPTLRQVLTRLGVKAVKKQRSGSLDFSCPLARWTHSHGTDRSGSAGAKINDHGPSAWVCHACKHHGRVASLVTTLGRFRGKPDPELTRFAELGEIMPMMAGFGAFEQHMEPDPEPPVEAQFDGLWDAVATVPEAFAYVAARGLGARTCETLNLLWDETQRRVLFPVRDRQGILWGFTGRSIDPEPTQTTARGEVVPAPKIRDYVGLPKRRLILGAERWRQGLPVLIVEGLFGYAHLVEIGAESTWNLGAILGSVMTPEKADILKNFDEPVYLMLDNDDAGDVGLFGPVDHDGTRRTGDGAVAQLVGYLPTYVPEWPEGKDDPDQLTVEDLERIRNETPLATRPE
jgi:hypothetical protein